MCHVPCGCSLYEAVIAHPRLPPHAGHPGAGGPVRLRSQVHERPVGSSRLLNGLLKRRLGFQSVAVMQSPEGAWCLTACWMAPVSSRAIPDQLCLQMQTLLGTAWNHARCMVRSRRLREEGRSPLERLGFTRLDPWLREARTTRGLKVMSPTLCRWCACLFVQGPCLAITCHN